ncbi:cell envelope integrity protein TolA [Ideonella livida]|nr:cell envelope integrity protein TolA [Ideonella livida]
MSARQADLLRPPSADSHGLGVSLALLIHLGLVGALTWSVQWRSEEPQPVAAELWAAVPQVAAPPAPEPPPTPEPTQEPEPAPLPPPPAPTPEPVRAPAPPPPVADREAEIALEKRREAERQARKEEERLQARREKERQEKLQAERERAEELAQQKALKEKAAKEKAAKEQAAREKAAKEKSDKERQAREDATRDKAAKEKAAREESARAEKLRQEQIQRMQAQLGGVPGATGGPQSSGRDLRDAAPSAAYAGRIKARIKPNIVLTEQVPGNPVAEVEVRAAPDGTILGRRLVKSSGNGDWDDAVLRAIDRTGMLPRDTDGRIPPTLLIAFKPYD